MTNNDILTIIKLRGPIRSPELEEEIFADKKLYTCYLESICSKYKEYEAYEPGDIAWLAYSYASEVIKGRWPEAESVIATDPYSAAEYALGILGRRWPEGEAAIRLVYHNAQFYNERFGTNI
jgi:hypothetical protein